MSGFSGVLHEATLSHDVISTPIRCMLELVGFQYVLFDNTNR